jgi:phosphoglycolate phosphatase-like HAD superfamily hydrolase
LSTTVNQAITHIFFDLHGTLVDGLKLHPCYAAQLGQVMRARYGGTAEAWTVANHQIALDWDSYYADLDLAQGIEQVYEGLYRITRALFRLTQISEPPHAELTMLSRELPGLVTPHCDGLYPDVKTAIEHLHRHGCVLGVTTHALYTQAVGLLEGGGILQHFQGVIVGVDTLEKWERDEVYYRDVAYIAKVAPQACLIVDDVPLYLEAAHKAGMQTRQVNRRKEPERTLLDFLGDV